MDKIELQQRFELFYWLTFLGDQIDRCIYQPEKASTALRRLRQAVADAKQSRMTPQQTAALVNLERALSLETEPAALWRVYGGVIEKRIEVLEDLATENALLRRVSQKEHHNWRNEAALLITEEECKSTLQACYERIGGTAPDPDLPEVDTLRALLRGSESFPQTLQGLLAYFSEYKSHLERVKLEAQAALAKWVARVEEWQREPKYRHILVVEDNDKWRVETTQAALAVTLNVGSVKVEGVGDCESAGLFVEEHAEEGIIAICDIGLPATAEEQRAGQWEEENGWRLIQALSQKCHVIAMTSIGRLDRDFVKLGNSADDFLLKEDETWRDDLRQRLTALLSSHPLSSLKVTVPAFDAQRILVGGVSVPLKPMAFAIVDALANGYPDSTERYFQMSPRYWEPDANTSFSKSGKLSLPQLKIVMCRREVADLKADFMEAFDRKQLGDHLREIRSALKEAFKNSGLVIDPRDFIRTLGGGDEEQYQLSAPSRVCNNPKDFYDATAVYRGPFRALVVEDEPVWRERIEKTLERINGLEVYTARTYEEALDVAVKRSPHLVALDLNIPRGDESKPEHGVRLREELTELLGETSFIVMTAFDIPRLRKELTRIIPGHASPQTADGAQVLLELRKRVQARAIFLKQHGAAAVQGFLLEAWRAQQELLMRGALSFEPPALYDVEVNTSGWGLRVNGREVKNIARDERNRARDQSLLELLASYPNVPIRMQAILDHWAWLDLLDDVHNPSQRLAERVSHIRKSIANADGELDGKDIIANIGNGYALVGNVTLTG
jgi:DNA-binding response OmpR family regulator